MKRLTGKIDPNCIRMQDTPRPPEGIVDRIKAMDCDTSLISDAMDDLGIGTTLPASQYCPTIAGARIVGPAVTVRNVISPAVPSVTERAGNGLNGMAEMEAHNLASAGDVLVIEGVEGLSNMGGISALIARQNGLAGAVIKGGIRDVGHSRAEGFPIWASERTPVTGKWRLKTVEINGPVALHGMHVRPGDLIVADDTGICVIPPDMAEAVVTRAEAQHALEAKRIAAVMAGVHIADLPKK